MSANGFYDLTPIYPPSFVGRNLSFVTGFTHRTNITYLELLMELYKWLRDTHIPEIDKILEDFRDKYENDFKNLKDDIDGTKIKWQELFDNFIANVKVEIAELNDSAMASLINNKLSLTTKALEEKYATIIDMNSAVNNGDLSFKMSYDMKQDNPEKAECAHILVRDIESSGLNIKHLLSNDDKTPLVSGDGESISSFQSRSAGDIVMNASGWWPATMRRVGLTIINGELIQDWEPSTQLDWGIESFVVFKDGHIELVARGEETSTSLVARGAWNAFTFGRFAIRNNVNMGLESNPKYDGVTGRQCIGLDQKRNLHVLSFPGATGAYGATISDVYRKANELKLTDLYMLDGGGSTQTMVNGYPIVRSSDSGGSRKVGDALIINAQDTSLTYYHSDWVELKLSDGVTKPSPTDFADVRLIRRNGYTVARIRMRLTGVTGGVQCAYIPRQAAWPFNQIGFVAASNGGNTVNVNISKTGNITAFGSALTPSSTFSFEAEYTVS